MAEQQLTTEQLEKRAEQQKRFNDELVKTSLLAKDIFKSEVDLGKEIKESIKKANKLNVEFGTGKNISKQISKERLNNASKIQGLENDIAVKQALLAKAQGEADIKRLASEINSIKTQIKINELIDAQLRGIEAILEEERKSVEEKRKQFTTVKGITGKINELSKNLPASLATLSGLFKTIIDGALRFSRISTETGKSLGYGADQADRVTNNLKNIATNATNTNITLTSLSEAMNQLSETTGFVSEYSADTLETQVMLTKQFGLTAEEAAGVYRFSVLTGKSSKAVNDAMVGAFVATRNSLKVGVPFKATIAEASKVSGRLAANLQNNPEQIVKAVVATKALGSSLEQTAKQGEALLNFESSIESELKAELITGKQLNLERARAAALVGDQVSLAQELSNQVGTLEDFQNMNVIQQKSIAEAVGLTVDELADQLRKQKLAIESGKSLAQITEEEATQAQQRQDIQTKFNNALLKMQDILGNIMSGPLVGVLEAFANVLSSSKGIVAAITALSAISLGKTLLSLASMATSLGLSAAGALTTASAISFGVGIFAILGSIAAAMGAFKNAKEEAVQPVNGPKLARGGIVMSEINNATIGEAGPEAIIPLNSSRASGILGGDLSPLVNAINEVKAAVNALANKPAPAVALNVDGQKLGEVVGRRPETGTNQYQNTYRLA